MTDEERKLLEVASEFNALMTEMINRALLASQRLCAEIQNGDPNAIKTAMDVEHRLGTILETWSGARRPPH